MDALVDSLAESWETGRKTLVFVRRVASVKEIKRKLDERYDRWLLGRLRRDEVAEQAHTSCPLRLGSASDSQGRVWRRVLPNSREAGA